jgi:hypothetical protein
MNPDLHARLSEKLYELNKGRPYRQRLSIDYLIQEAVKQWLSGAISSENAPASTQSSIDPEKFAGAQLTLPDRQSIELSVEEWRWVGRVLEIVRGGRPEAMRPLDTNLDAFVVLTNLLTRGSGATSPGDRVPGASPKNLAGALERLRDSESEARASLEDAQRAAEDLRAAKRGVRGRGGRNKSGGTGGG